MKFKAVNNTDKTEFTIFVDDCHDSRLFWHFKVKLPEGYADGEYTYYVYTDDMKECVAQGIMQIGNYDIKDKKVYARDEKGYIQYGTE